MAPQPPSGLKKPSARTLRLQRITGQIHPLLPSKTFRPDAAVTDNFLSTKRDKRIIKHSSFVSRISSSGIKKTNKRRRPSKKLVTSLDGLADALPDLPEGDEVEKGKVRHKSLNSKRGALKKKERIVKGEMERFGVSMARLTSTGTQQQVNTTPSGIQKDDDEGMTDKVTETTTQPPATSNRWAALRGYISSTMEQNPAFAK